MTNVRTAWIFAACWVAVTLAVFLFVDASSARSWVYLAAIALLPPVVLIRLWPTPSPQTVDDIIHGRERQS
jgi:heme/copper-type cytochrome/quinol oxidase subunit 4